MQHAHGGNVVLGKVRWSPVKSLRWVGMVCISLIAGSAKLGLYSGEWDPGWWVLVLLERTGWVWRLRLPADCPPRPELRSHDVRAGTRPVRGMRIRFCMNR